MTTTTEKMVIVGKVGTAHGVQGWVKIHSFTQPAEQLANYSPWYLKKGEQWQAIEIDAAQMHGNGLKAKFAHCDDRDTALNFTNLEIGVPRKKFPKLPKGEYYWVDLQGLLVKNLDGIELGTIDHLFSTGANDVIVIKGDKEHLLPFVKEHVVKSVDLTKGEMIVDWDPAV